MIDTASNYRDGRAQKAVGKAVHALRLSGKIDRKALFFSTKAGFVDQTILQKLKSKSKIHEGDILGGASCIHPVCLEDSLRTSLQDMQLETVTSDFGSIDFVFIPEKLQHSHSAQRSCLLCRTCHHQDPFNADCRSGGVPLQFRALKGCTVSPQVDLLYLHNVAEMFPAPMDTDLLHKRLRTAFQWLEQARSKGRIRAYGLATWSCFREPLSSQGHVSLQDIVHIAREVGGLDHGFRQAWTPQSCGSLRKIQAAV